MKIKKAVKEKDKEYDDLITDIGKTLELGRKATFRAIDHIPVRTYWEIGRKIVEFEQGGKEKAEHGSGLLLKLSRELVFRYGKGLNRRNVYYMRKFYLSHRKLQTLSAKLSWSHYVEVLDLDEDLERQFYEKQCEKETWSVRELRRQIDSCLYQRLVLSKKEDLMKILKLSKNGQIIEEPKDILKEPYILEFINIRGNQKYTEKELEQAIIDNLQLFLLELGKGFTFVARQFRISLGNKHFYIDLVFYHRILKCFVLIDLKTASANHTDIGQMNLYLNYFKAEENSEKDNPPIGIVLSAENNEVEIEYALAGISNKLFVSKYKLYLPDKELLREKIKMILENRDKKVST